MKPSLHRSAVLLSIVWLVAADAAAQSNYDQWTTDDGLPQGSINDIVQTRDGYLWLATFGGLVRFDGSRFVVFDTDVEGIRSQRFRVLREDSEGTLWAATEDGLLVTSGRLRSNQANALVRPLENALRSLERGLLRPACAQVFLFQVAVTVRILQGALTPREGIALINEATSIPVALGC